MKLLLDTQLLLWAAGQPERLSSAARKQLSNSRNELFFSAASIWEITIKNSLGRDDFRVEPRLLRRGLLDNGYTELPVTSEHAVNVDSLPLLHKDPFDRILLAQAFTEGITLITADAQLARYPGPVRKV
ncbi:MAG TPA: type II toxin-antitoxin system VapC family toxin [Thermoanaerobaculia bacterium]|nr:type II toxin-antitoxin system VapC family toxin [Thermoanaerobaculia bacterium]